MKIGILLINYNPNYRGGLNSYIEGLIDGLIKEDKKNDYYILTYQRNKKYYQKYTSSNFHSRSFPDPGNKSLMLKYYLLMFFTAPLLRMFYFYLESVLYRRLIRQIDRLGLDIIYSPSVPFFPMKLKGKLIVSPHDIQQLHFPQYFSLTEKWYRATVFPETFLRAKVIQASSNFMKRDFIKFMRTPQEKIRIIPEGVMDIFLDFKPVFKQNELFLKKYKLKGGYLFYPAQHWPHKNHITLLKAAMHLEKKYCIEVKIVFTGEVKSRFTYLYDFVKENELTRKVIFLGNIKFSELFYAYENAEIVVIPGEYESSSLPVREAMALGKPVIAARNGSNEEINLDNNIVLFSTYNYKELAENIRKLLKNKELCDNLVVKSRRIVKDYSWKKVARKYVDIFNKGLEL